MSLQPQAIAINFSQGVNTKVDKWQLPLGQFSRLTNSIFSKQGMLQKRNGFGLLTVANSGAAALGTLNGGLFTLGQDCQSYSTQSEDFTNGGMYQALNLDASTLVRSATSQTTCDVAVSSNGLACSVWLDSDGLSYYQVSNSLTGQIVAPAVSLGATSNVPRVVVHAGYFIVTFLISITGTVHLQYVAVPINNPGSPLTATDISVQVDSINAAYDVHVCETLMYIAWNASDVGGAIRVTYLNQSLQQPAEVIKTSVECTYLAITCDETTATPTVWVSYFDTDTVYGMAFNNTLLDVLTPTTISAGISDGINALTSTATDNELTVIYENINAYSFNGSIQTNYISTNTLSVGGTAGSASIVCRGVGLASKAILSETLEKIVFLSVYGQDLQPTLYLMDIGGNVLARFAMSNTSGYMLDQILPQMIEQGTILKAGYLYAAQIQPVNKEQGVANAAGIYSQTGINLASFELDVQPKSLEIGGSAYATGGMLWQYDGAKIREQGFNVWPEDVQSSSISSLGSMAALNYFYQVTYEWTDAAGQIHRSAPSVPLNVDLSGAGGSTNRVTLHIPTLRQTYKTGANRARIVVYRWSEQQQIYYQVSTVASPTLNDTTVDSVNFVDTFADSSIIGNNILYTTGGILENVACPACDDISLWQNRLGAVLSEDPNTTMLSKVVIKSTPVEMSDLLTIFVAPTTGSQGSTGTTRALASMDDKIIFFKKDAIYYANGSGPDSTGANGSFSDPVYITGTVGCSNPKSIVLTPMGLMFQSDKGIWLLGRDLSTKYIGAPVEDFTQYQLVTSALAIPETNQVRFTLDNTQAIMYDYYYDQWGDWTNVSALSSVIIDDLHTYLDTYGNIVQETPEAYLDRTQPVTMSFTTGWYNLAGLQGYQRFYELQLLGRYLTPHFLDVSIAYDYNNGITQSTVITPIQISTFYGDAPLYGSDLYGGQPDPEEWRVFPTIQKCTSFRLTVQEQYDRSQDVEAGAGLTLSGVQCMVGLKKANRVQSARTSVG